MFSLIKQVFIVLLSFRKSLVTKYVSLNNEKYMIIPFQVDLNTVDLKYYPFMISLDKCNGNCNFVNELSMRICVQNKTKYVNVNLSNMITNRSEAKTLVKYV